jgi:pyocin large subunit-like protein
MSWALISKVQKTKVGSPSAKSLLLALANYADAGGEHCFPGQVVLQEITELSLDTIQRQLRYLIERGFVSAQKRRRKGQWASWDYKINVSALTDQVTPDGSNDQTASSGSDCEARMGATHFLTKTLPKVAAEMALSVLAYNLTRVMNIVGIKPLMAAIAA